MKSDLHWFYNLIKKNNIIVTSTNYEIFEGFINCRNLLNCLPIKHSRGIFYDGNFDQRLKMSTSFALPVSV